MSERSGQPRVKPSGAGPVNQGSLRLGDLIDDYCPRCKLLLNHAVASLLDGQVMKVICQTCYSEHAYHRGQGGKKKPAGRQTLFDQVLSNTAPVLPAASASGPPKPAAEPARYISRHRGKSPTKKR